MGETEPTERNEPTSVVHAASARHSQEQEHREPCCRAPCRGKTWHLDRAPRTETSANLRSSKKGIPGSGKNGQRNRKGRFEVENNLGGATSIQHYKIFQIT